MSGKAVLDFATAAHSNIEHAENALHFALDNWMVIPNHPANLHG